MVRMRAFSGRMSWADHPVVLVIGLLGIAQHKAIRHARGAHDYHTLGLGLLQGLTMRSATEPLPVPA